jgi:hypothetical protein
MHANGYGLWRQEYVLWRADALSNKQAYPTFVRTVPPKPLYKYAIAGLMQWAGWKQAMLLSSNAESYVGL